MSAICPCCNQQMTSSEGCTLESYDDFKDQIKRERIKWGEETLLGVRMQLASSAGVADPFDNPLSLDDPRAKQFLEMVKLGPYFDQRRCPDCNAAAGHFHHEGCDTEECPSCHLQSLGCSCIASA